MQYYPLLFSGALAGITVLLAVGVAIALVRRARAPRPGGVAGYERPEGIDLPEAGHLQGRQHRMLEATLVDLAVRGFVTIVRESRDGFLLELRHDSGLTTLERRVVHVLFGRGAAPGAQRRVLGRDARKGTRWTMARSRTDSAAARELERRGLLRARRFDGSLLLPITTFVILGGTVVAGVLWLTSEGFSWLVPLTIVYALVATIALGALAAAAPLPLTADGAAMRDRLTGLRLSLDPAAGLVGDVAVYESLLPFAVLWGLEQQAATSLRLHLDAEPQWWFSPLDDFASSLAAVSRALSSDTDAGGGTDGREAGDPTDGYDGDASG